MSVLSPAPFLLNTFQHHYRGKYGEQVGKVVLDPGVPCLHRQQGGCLFCRPESFRPAHLQGQASPAKQLAMGKKLLQQRKIRRYFVYFQQETPSALPAEMLLAHAAGAADDPACVGLILAARPDCMSDALLEALASSIWGRKRELAIELGVQSLHDRSLAWLERGHDTAVFFRTMARLRQIPGCQVGIHLILGIPGETTADMAASIRGVCAAGATSLKLHHLQVIRGTRLAALHEATPLPLPGADDYLHLLAELLPLIPPHVVLHRLWATAHPQLLLAPRWGRRSADLRRRLERLLCHRGLSQGCQVAA